MTHIIEAGTKNTIDYDREEAFNIIREWAKEFTEKYRDHQYDGESSYYDLVDKFIKDKIDSGW